MTFSGLQPPQQTLPASSNNGSPNERPYNSGSQRIDGAEMERSIPSLAHRTKLRPGHAVTGALSSAGLHNNETLSPEVHEAPHSWCRERWLAHLHTSDAQ